MAVVSALCPRRQLTVRDDDNASRFVEQHDRVIEVHKFFVAQPRVHHIVDDDKRTTEPVFVFLLLLVNVAFRFESVEEAFDGIVADLDVCFKRFSPEMTGERSLPGTALADDEKILIFVDPRELFKLFDLPLDPAVELFSQKLLLRQAALVFLLHIPRTLSETDLLLEDALYESQILFGRAGQVNIPAGDIVQLKAARQLHYLSDC